MAKAAAINLNDAFSPPAHSQVVDAPITYGDFLPSLANGAGPGPGSIGSAASKLSGQVLGLSTAKERASSGGSRGGKRPSGPGFGLPTPPLPHLSDGSTGGQQNAKLPPLMHSYGGGTSPGYGRAGTLSQSQQLGQQVLAEVVQPTLQHPAMLPGPTPASHPYQPKRKPPSAFMRNNPMRQQLEANHMRRSGSAGSSRSYGAASHDNLGFQQVDASMQQDLQQQQQFADQVIAAAQAAILQGQQQQQQYWDGGNGLAVGGFSAAPPWGVSSVSDLEALDSILDQLVVVDARMRKALLKGPLISFETVVPEHIMNAGRQPQPQRADRTDDNKDRTFLTAVKGMVEEGGGEAGPGEEAADVGEIAEFMPSGAGGPPPSPVAREDTAVTSGVPTHGQASRPSRATDEGGEPRDNSLFPASIPNPGMHPTFTRAYLASKLAVKPQHLPPPAPATAEHLLRSRPPPFIAAPSYDQLCSQIRDVQRQYTCGTSRPGQSAAGAGTATAAAPTVAPPAVPTNQYIAGLDGPTLDEVVAHQELPISLERVRPTFVALKQKAGRSASPKRRPGSPGRVFQSDGPGEVAGIVTGQSVSS